MKTVKFSVKLRRLIKSLLVAVFIFFIALAGSAFMSEGSDSKAAAVDSLMTDKSGFKSLFVASYFDPTKPYVTQLNPKAVPFVQNYIKSTGPELEKMKHWGKPYFDMYDGILAQHGIPVELKYLSVIESSLVSNVVSHAGAVGPWQIMDYEARRMGLRVDSEKDERTNFYKSTHAAARILKELHREFNDWLLVVGAYNCGSGRMRQAIRKSGSKNFWDLQYNLPEETRNHVKRFIGTHYIFEGSGGLTTMTADEITDFNAAKKQAKADGLTAIPTETIKIAGRYKAAIICDHLGMEIGVFNKLNPNFDKMIAIGNYVMHLPFDKIDLFVAKKPAILNESVQFLLNN